MSLFDGYQVNQEISTIIKIYPTTIRLYKFKVPFVIHRYDYDPYNPNIKQKSKVVIKDEDNERKSLKRAKTTLIDLTLCNQFELFTTFTFAKNRSDIDAKKRQMAYWLNNQRILHGSFNYLIVPEFHKDGKSLHFHGLFHGYNGKLVDSGHVQNGRIIYNISSFKGGFTTAVIIDNLEKVSSYISKYITKDMPKFKNKQRYWCSNGLKRPLKIVNPLLNDEDEKLFNVIYTDKHKEILETFVPLSDADIARIADYGRRREDDLRIQEW